MADPSTFTLASRALKLTTAADIEPHLEPLKGPNAPKDLKTLNISGNTLGHEAAEALSTHLSTLTALQDANLADLFTGRLLSEIPPALSALLTALAKLPGLTHINLNDNAFGLNTVGPLVEYIPAAVPLEYLLLNNNGLGPEAGTKVANALTALATRQKDSKAAGIKTIVCGRNRLEQGSMPAWAEAVQAHAATLQEVRMVQNGIRPQGVEHFLRNGLVHCTQLRIFDFQDNTFTATGGKALAEVVGKWTELRELGLGDSLLSTRGMVQLAKALGQGNNKKLEVLKLQYNEIDARGIRALVETLQVEQALPLLRRVELNGNRFSEDDESVEQLRVILEERKTKLATEDADENDWGMDELSDLEDEDDDEDGEDLDDLDDGDEQIESKLADEAENENVAQEKDKAVDDLADSLGKTNI